MSRDLEKSELFIACPLCLAPKGKPCVYYFNNEQGVSAVAHVERKRAAGREHRITIIIAVLNRHGIQTTHGSETTPGAIEIANDIDDAVHEEQNKRITEHEAKRGKQQAVFTSKAKIK